jgi:hypothetical protein
MQRLPYSIHFREFNRRHAITTTVRFLLRGILTNTLSSEREQNVGGARPSNQRARIAADRVGLDAVGGILGEEPRGGRAGGGGVEDPGPVAVVPEVDAPRTVEPVGERLELVVGRDGEQVRRGVGGGAVGVPGALEVRDGVAELGALAHLVELTLAGQARLEELLRLLGLHPLPLPLGHAAGVRARPAAHADGEVAAAERPAAAAMGDEAGGVEEVLGRQGVEGGERRRRGD